MLTVLYGWLVVLPTMVALTALGSSDLRTGHAGWAAAEFSVALIASVETMWLSAG